MKKIIRVESLCCKACAKHAENKLKMLDGVFAAKSNLRKNVLLIEHDARVTDQMLQKTTEEAGFTVLSVEVRKGLFY
jgi:copper chaperone CopZ